MGLGTNLSKLRFNDARVAAEISLPEKHLTGSYVKHSWRSSNTLVMFALCLLPLTVPGIIVLTGSSIPFIDSNLLLVLLLIVPIPHLLFTGRNQSP